MKVQVKRVWGMPHNTAYWIKDLPGRFLIYLDGDEYSEVAARAMELAIIELIPLWARRGNGPQRPDLRLHTG